MTDIRELFERHAREQKALKDLSWPEKVRLVARLRLQIIELRRKEQILPSEESRTR
jgi:hypothetical protein